jgi:hypothetical protein
VDLALGEHRLLAHQLGLLGSVTSQLTPTRRSGRPRSS